MVAMISFRMSAVISETSVGAHELLALRVNFLALRIHDVVIFQHVLTHVEVARFDLFLRFLQGLIDPRVNDRFTLLQA